MAKTQALAGQVFLTKKALRAAIRKILHQSPLNKNLQGNNYRLVRALLDQHPSADQKIGCGVQSIQVVKFKPYNHRGFELKRTDGTRTDFSYIQCLNSESKLTKVKRAFRWAISPDIITFRNTFFIQINPVCEISNRPITAKTSDVDHAPPMTFKNIFEEFIEKYSVSIDKIKLFGCNVDGATTYDIENSSIKELWIQFHRTHARLRILHKDVHVKIAHGEIP